MKIEELRTELEAKKVEVRSFLDAKDVVKAEVAMEEKRNLEKQIAIEEELEAEEKRKLEGQKTKERGVDNMESVNEMRSVVKKVMGMEMSEEERAMVKSADNAPVIPKQFVNELEIIQKGFGSLKEYCDVKQVTKNEGTIPMINLDQNELADVLEGADIVDGVLVTTDLTFKCSKVGLVMPLSSEILEDAEVEIEGLVKDSFANSATSNENKKIIKVIKDNAVAIVGATDYEDVENTMDSALPSVKAGLVTVTNTKGFVHLKNRKDSTGNKLNLVTEVNGKYIFNSKELIVVDDAILAPSEAEKQIFYVLNFKEAVKFLDRKAVTIERWRESKNDSYNISILERFDVTKGSVRSIKSIEF